MTREKMKQMVKKEVLEFDRDYGRSAEEVSEAIMKLWDNGLVYEVETRTVGVSNE